MTLKYCKWSATRLRFLYIAWQVSNETKGIGITPPFLSMDKETHTATFFSLKSLCTRNSDPENPTLTSRLYLMTAHYRLLRLVWPYASPWSVRFSYVHTPGWMLLSAYVSASAARTIYCRLSLWEMRLYKGVQLQPLVVYQVNDLLLTHWGVHQGAGTLTICQHWPQSALFDSFTDQ